MISGITVGARGAGSATEIMVCRAAIGSRGAGSISDVVVSCVTISSGSTIQTLPAKRQGNPDQENGNEDAQLFHLVLL